MHTNAKERATRPRQTIKTLIAEWTLQSENLEDFQRWSRRYDLTTMGYLPVTQQRCFSVILKRDRTNIAKVTRGLRMLVPLLKPFPNKHGLEGHAYIGIFEHTLSENGSYWMLVAKDMQRATVIKSYHYQESVEFSGALSEVMNYVAKNHWYDPWE